MNCTKCNESLTDSVSCAQCSGAYHYVCAGVSETSYKKMGPEKRAAWRCITCRAVVSTDNTTNAEILRELKNLKSEFNSFKLDLDTVKRDTHDTVDAVRELTLSWTSLETRINLIEERMGELELKITKISTDCDSSREEVALLKHNHNLQDQFSRLNNVEILGVPSKSGENLHNIVSDICAVTGFRLEPTDVDTVHRVRQFATHDGQAPRPPAIVVRFTRRRRKDELLAAARARRTVTTADIKLAGPQSKIFINEHLTPSNKLLLKRARELKSELNYSYLWDRYDTVTSGETGAGPSRGGGVLIAVERGLRVRRRDDWCSSQSAEELWTHRLVDISHFDIPEDLVKEHFDQLDVSKGPGYDDVHPFLIKKLSSELSVPLTIIYNKSITEGCWKIFGKEL
ncbi:unnamed protein product [Leptosia nina]|uniref:PHD-type domain-containing protein n=1 Tax=Leptosia nina TaxID=320188 RepID=A0AAV1JH86_9NEOP